MVLSSADGMTGATYIALLISILSLWLARPIWGAVFIVAIGLGYASGVLAGLAAVWMGLLAVFCLLYRKKKFRIVSVLGIITLALLLALHALPGFNNYRVANGLVLSPGAAPYSLYLNFDKTAAGLLILGILHPPLLRTGAEWRTALRRAAPILILNIVVLIPIGLALGYLRFDPKWTAFFWIWAPVNLFFTCLSEEAFFRGFIQRELSSLSPRLAPGPWPAVAASALLFGLAHFAGGWSYVLLAAIAGIGYAWVYQRTQRIEMSMLAHFALNATHFLLLTYPAVRAAGA
jgi:membrane protease YdiL (CAAX protease family)